MGRIYYDKDANIGYLKGRTIGIIGYGIQGRAQALNMRDSGVKVLVANRRDRYASCARKDGFRVYDIVELGKISDIILFLIPDQAQAAHAHIRGDLARLLGPGLSEGIRILYGGSVKPDNAGVLLSQADVDGALVGGACLKAESFFPIIRAAG